MRLEQKIVFLRTSILNSVERSIRLYWYIFKYSKTFQSTKSQTIPKCMRTEWIKYLNNRREKESICCVDIYTFIRFINSVKRKTPDRSPKNDYFDWFGNELNESLFAFFRDTFEIHFVHIYFWSIQLTDTILTVRFD